VLRQYVDFAGRARRKEYWMFTLVSVIISLMFGILDGALGTAIPGLPYGLAVLLPGLAMGVRPSAARHRPERLVAVTLPHSAGWRDRGHRVLGYRR
jgi:uncharacterized membrane protein YhaH (DUF805 family)